MTMRKPSPFHFLLWHPFISLFSFKTQRDRARRDATRRDVSKLHSFPQEGANVQSFSTSFYRKMV